MSNRLPSKEVLIVDFASSGHHPKYLRQLVRYGLRMETEGRTRLLIARELLIRTERELAPEDQIILRQRTVVIEDHPAYIWLLKWVRIQTIVETLFVEYIIAQQASDCEILLFYLDPFLYQLAFSPLPRKCVSGLLFRASFHHRSKGFRPAGIREHFLYLAKYITCYVCAWRQGVHRVLGLDPFAQQYAEVKWLTTKYITIPDPIGPEPDAPMSYFAPRKRVQDSRLIFLLCGELSRRKGVLVVLRALAALEPDHQRRVRLRLVGAIHGAERDLVLAGLKNAREVESPAGLLLDLDDRFVSDEELDNHIADADVVLALYERSYGSSGTLIRAAAFGRPLIATDEGFVGHCVRVHRLGAPVNVHDIDAVAEAFRKFIVTGVVKGFDEKSARDYASSCSPDDFAQRLLGYA